jgi:hypothetical protein
MLAFWKLASASLERVDKSPDRGAAMFAMCGFTELHESVWFPKLDVNVIAFQMMLRLLKPERVHQRDFGLCGPAHFVTLMIKSKPVKYVSMAMDLLAKGSARAEEGKTIEPNEYVRGFDPGPAIAQADWLLAASFRNADGPIPEGKGRETYSGTQGPEVVQYLLQAGYPEIVSIMAYQRFTDSIVSVFSKVYAQFYPPDLETSIGGMFDGEKPSAPATNFKIACQLRARGWRVMLLTNSELFTFQPPLPRDFELAKEGKTFNQNRIDMKKEEWKSITQEKKLGGIIAMQNFDHWVLAKNIALKNGIVTLCVYTWGGQHDVKRELKMEEFANCYAGFVAARG